MWQYSIHPLQSSCPNFLIIATRTILGPNKYFIMSNTSYITFSMLFNRQRYMLLIGASTQHLTPYFQPLGGYITDNLTSLIHFSIYIWHPIVFMWISMLYQILIHLLLLLSTLKDMIVHQLLWDYSLNWILTFSISYLPIQWSIQANRALDDLHSPLPTISWPDYANHCIYCCPGP